MGRARRALAGAAVAAVVAAVPAHGATASLEGAGVRYEAAPGERNELSVSLETIGPVLIVELHDRGASIMPGPGCILRAADRALCFPLEAAVNASLADADDVLLGAGHAVRLMADGGAGADDLRGGPAADALTGGTGADRLAGADSADVLGGGPDNDRLEGDDGDDLLDGGGEDDSLDGGLGADELVGGGDDEPHLQMDDDIADYSARDEDLSITLDGVADDGAAGENDALSGIESVWGGSGDDIISGSGVTSPFGPNYPVTRGNDGNDTLAGGGTLEGGTGGDHLRQMGRARGELYGGTGDDLLEAEFGAHFYDGPGDDTSIGSDDWGGWDVFHAQPGADYYEGNNGNNEVWYSDPAEVQTGVTVTLDDQPGDGRPGENDHLVEINRVEGSVFDDRIEGSAQAEGIRGVAGVDVLLGGGGNDTVASSGRFGTVVPDEGGDKLFGGDGNDGLYGGGGVDEIHGGSGDDGLEGGDADDLLFGEAGRDLVNGLFIDRGFAPSKISEGGADLLSCGDDEDEAIVGVLDHVESNCERQGPGPERTWWNVAPWPPPS